VIGDIHGQGAMLDALLAALPRIEEDVTVFLGDYIDRGWSSSAVVARVQQMQDDAPDRTVLLWGNHEDLAAHHFGLPFPTGIDYDPMAWFHNGGVETMATYGWAMTEMLDAPCPPDLATLFPRLKTFYRPPIAIFPELGNVVCVHAGLLPGELPEMASAETLLWVRDEFLEEIDRESGRLVIHGHTPLEAVVPMVDKIGIDSGAAYGGPLTALQLPERRIFQAFPDGQVTVGALAAGGERAPGRLQYRRR